MRFAVGDRVECRDFEGEWESGTVQGTEPLTVRKEGAHTPYEWDEVRHVPWKDDDQVRVSDRQTCPMRVFTTTFSSKSQATQAAAFYTLGLCTIVVIYFIPEGQVSFSKDQYTYVHGLVQLVTWAVLVPIGGVVAMFLRERKWWLQVHLNVQSTASFLQIPVIYAAQRGGCGVDHCEMYWHTHELVGYCILLVGGAQALTGMLLTGGPKLPFTRLRFSRVLSVSKTHKDWMRWFHKGAGRVLLLVGFIQLLLGFSSVYKFSIGWYPHQVPQYQTVLGLMGWVLGLVIVMALLYRRKVRVEAQRQELSLQIRASRCSATGLQASVEVRQQSCAGSSEEELEEHLSGLGLVKYTYSQVDKPERKHGPKTFSGGISMVPEPLPLDDASDKAVSAVFRISASLSQHFRSQPEPGSFLDTCG